MEQLGKFGLRAGYGNTAAYAHARRQGGVLTPDQKAAVLRLVKQKLADHANFNEVARNVLANRILRAADTVMAHARTLAVELASLSNLQSDPSAESVQAILTTAGTWDHVLTILDQQIENTISDALEQEKFGVPLMMDVDTLHPDLADAVRARLATESAPFGDPVPMMAAARTKRSL